MLSSVHIDLYITSVWNIITSLYVISYVRIYLYFNFSLELHRRINNGCVLKCKDVKKKIILQCRKSNKFWIPVSEVEITQDGPDTLLLRIEKLRNGESYDFRMLAKDKADDIVCYISEKVEIKGFLIILNLVAFWKTQNTR